MSGTLYVVATPIGNLKDITRRAIEVLNEVDFILAEDTRVTMKLLHFYDIHGKKLISFHEHNEEKKIDEVEKLLKDGSDIALVSDAGTPLIQDPGYRLIRHLRKNGYPIVPIPGPSALISALSVSGLSTDAFVFLGFLPHKKKKRHDLYQRIRDLNMTCVIYESVHRIDTLLEELCEIFPDREIFVAREMTKVHEEYYYGKVCEIKDNIKKKGEFVIIVGKSYER